MRSILAITGMVISLAMTAQTQLKIKDVNALVTDPGLARNKEAIEAMKTHALSEEQLDLVLRYSAPELYPLGIRTDSARTANAVYVQNYVVFPVAQYKQDTSILVILMAPAQSNDHMPEDMRPVADLYLVAHQWGLMSAKDPKERPVISRGPRWKDLPAARIVRPDELYATYALGEDASAMEALSRAGLSQAEKDAVVFRGHERNWPEGIDRFDRRQANLASFGKYKAVALAEWDNKVLLIIPVEKNKHMPTLMRPYVDVYFVYAKGAVSVKASKRKR